MNPIPANQFRSFYRSTRNNPTTSLPVVNNGTSSTMNIPTASLPVANNNTSTTMNNATASLPIVNNSMPINDPTDRQDQPPPRKKSTRAKSTREKSTRKTSRIDTTSNDPRLRGRGFTGGPRGRPMGAKNKPKAPEDDQPKTPKKKGRPKGAKNKHPRRAFTPQPPTPTDDRSPVDSGSPQSPPPEAQHPFVLHPNVLPEAVRTYRTPDEYVPYGYVPAEQTLPARHPQPDDFFTNMFNNPPAAPSPYHAPRFSEYGPVPDFGNRLPSSMSPEGKNNLCIDPRLLNNRYTPNDPAIFNNHNNNSSSSSIVQNEAMFRELLESENARL